MKILLICSAGASTSAVVAKMQEAAVAMGETHEIKAMGTSEAIEVAQEWDVLLLGPQLRNELKKYAERFPNKPLDSIPPIFYGRLDGKGVLDLAKKLANK